MQSFIISTMPKLCINVDHIATVREARKGTEPDPLEGTLLAIEGGADGITVHLREDRRHIKDRDVLIIRKNLVDRIFTLEMAATNEMVEIAKKIKPDLITLVPEKRQELTTEGGLDVIGQKEYLINYLDTLHKNDLTISIFINADLNQIKTAKEIGADFVEIHTGPYANNPNPIELKIVTEAINFSNQIGLKTNAGHGLNYENTGLIARIPGIQQLHIGHSIVSRAVFIGIKQAVREMKEIIEVGIKSH